MSALLERLRAALAPDYEIHQELASGGMGVVFQAQRSSLSGDKLGMDLVSSRRSG